LEKSKGKKKNDTEGMAPEGEFSASKGMAREERKENLSSLDQKRKICPGIATGISRKQRGED